MSPIRLMDLQGAPIWQYHMRGLMGFMLRTWANELEEALAYNPQIA